MANTTTTTTTTSVSFTDLYMFYVTMLQALICIVGMVLNAPIIYVTIKHKKLHKTYGYYLAICVFLDILFEFSSMLPTVLVIAQMKIPLIVCFFVQWYGPFASSIVMALNLVIGIDRLLAVLFPVWFINFTHKNTAKMVLCMTALSSVNGFYLIPIMFRYAVANPEKPVYCQITDIVQGDAQTYGYYVTFVLNGCILFTYLLVWILLQVLKQHDAIARRVFNTLATVVGTIFCLWLFQSLVITFLMPLMSLSADTQYLVIRLLSQTVRVASALNTPILYFCSSDYRTIFRLEFGRAVRCFKHLSVAGGVSSTAPGTTQNQNRQQSSFVRGQRHGLPVYSMSSMMRQIQVS